MTSSCERNLPAPSCRQRYGWSPSSKGARPLVVAPNQIGDVPETEIMLGRGDPAIFAGLFPHCGCDAYDDGAKLDLDSLDDRLSSTVSVEYRRLTRGDHEVITETDQVCSATGEWKDGELEAVLADPTKWQEL